MSDETISAVIEAVATTATEITDTFVRSERLSDEINPSGEVPLEIDQQADERLAENITAIDGIGEYASEERETPINCGSGFSITVDPLDGSSNVHTNNPVGMIFGIYDSPLPAAGTALLASGYVVLGPVTTMVCAVDGYVSEYRIREGERELITSTMTLPSEPGVYGFGGSVSEWSPEFTDFARRIEHQLTLRYCGALVADTNQILHSGGIFGYPSLKSRPSGKLRLQFEAIPMGHIIEMAGGRSSNGHHSVLAGDVSTLHQRTPLFLGNASLIDELEDSLSVRED